jgi:hypothetical protein
MDPFSASARKYGVMKPKEESGEVLGYMTNTEVLPNGPLPRTRRKVAIVGFAPSTMTDARSVFTDPDFEVWAINQLYVAFLLIAEHATRWFQFHHRSSYQEAIRDHDHHNWLKTWSDTKERPVYMMRREHDIPYSVKFPRKEIKELIRPYFTNTISWLIALAEYEGFEGIHVYGVDMAQDEEYMEQRPSVEYYLGRVDNTCIHSENCDMAKKRQLFVPARCDLLKNLWEYPYEDHQPFRQRIDSRRKELRERAEEAKNLERNARDARIQRIGIIEYINGMKEKGELPEHVEKLMEEHRVQLRSEIDLAAHDEQQGHDNAVGCYAAIENMRYIQRNWNQCANELAILEGDRSKKETEQ